jgi:hypothetical protein
MGSWSYWFPWVDIEALAYTCEFCVGKGERAMTDYGHRYTMLGREKDTR